MAQKTDIVQESDSFEVEYVPDIECPKCGTPKRLNRRTYEWYGGGPDELDGWPLKCGRCAATFLVKIGNFQPDPYGGYMPASRPFDSTTRGGILVKGPALVENTEDVPPVIEEGLESDSIPDSIKATFRTARSHFLRQDYQDAAVRCRATMEATIADQGLQLHRGHLSAMAIQAKNQGLLTEADHNLCLAVASYGGDAAHPQSNPSRVVSRDDALMVINITANLLRRIYLPLQSSPATTTD